MGLKRFLRSPADHDHSTLFVLCQKTEWMGGWVMVGGFWLSWIHIVWTFETLQLSKWQWLITDVSMKTILKLAKNNYLIWSDGQQICNINPSDNMYPYVPTIWTHIYTSTYNMYPYLCTICTHIYIPYLAIFIYNMYPHTYIYNMFLYLSIHLEICTTTSKFSYQYQPKAKIQRSWRLRNSFDLNFSFWY